MLYNIGYTNTNVINLLPFHITRVMLLYNTEWQYDHGMAVNYCSKKFHNTEPRVWPWAENSQFLENLSPPWVLVLQGHDIPFWKPQKVWNAHIGQKLREDVDYLETSDLGLEKIGSQILNIGVWMINFQSVINLKVYLHIRFQGSISH
jgi:hypothetical protein